MSELTQFFTSQIGQTLHTEVVTGKTSYSEVYARRYSATVLHLPTDNQVVVHLTSYDLTPGGLRAGGSDQRLGDCTICLTGCYGLVQFWQRVISGGDRAFAGRYGAHIIHMQ